MFEFRYFTKSKTKHRSSPVQKSSVEAKKAVIHTSFWTALNSCRIHFIPAGVTTVILLLTFRNHYIGTSFKSLIESETLNLLLLQIAAKVQELLIVSSLAIIIFHIARTELLFGDGLPLGLVGAGLLFGNLGYFISPEFTGSLSYKGSKWRKARFLTLLLIAGLTAALTGPATAVLIVPRKGTELDGGGSSYYINGSQSQIWPIVLDESVTGNLPYCVGASGTRYAVCPSAGFQSLWSQFGQVNLKDFWHSFTSATYSKELSGTYFRWTISSPHSLFPRVFTLGLFRKPFTREGHTFLIQPHAATSVLLEKLTTDWFDTLLWRDRRISDDIDDRIAESRTTNVITRAGCSPPRNLSRSENVVEFPVFNPQMRGNNHANFTVANLSTNAMDHLSFRWVRLPSAFGTSSIGAVFESAWTPDHPSRIALGCNIQSNWINSTLINKSYNFWSGWYPWNTTFGQELPPWEPPTEGKPLSPTNGRIAVTDEWLDMLTPPSTDLDPGNSSWQPTTIERILMNTELVHPVLPGVNTTSAEEWDLGDVTNLPRSTLLETIICAVFNDGVSRSGSHLLFKSPSSNSDPTQWELATYNPSTNFNNSILAGDDALILPKDPHATLHVKFKFTGYAFTGSLAGYLSMSVLLVHLVFALGHTIWVLSRRKTSDSWDSMSKIITLAHNSQPSITTLTNTSAGINRRSTYKNVAKIRVTHEERGGGGSSGDEKVELVFPEKEEMHDLEWSGVELRPTSAAAAAAGAGSDWRPTHHSARSDLTVTSLDAASLAAAKTSVTSLLRPAGFEVIVEKRYGRVIDDVKYA